VRQELKLWEWWSHFDAHPVQEQVVWCWCLMLARQCVTLPEKVTLAHLAYQLEQSAARNFATYHR